MARPNKTDTPPERAKKGMMVFTVPKFGQVSMSHTVAISGQ